MKWMFLFLFARFIMITEPIQAEPQNHPPKRGELSRSLYPALYQLLYLQDGGGQHIIVHGDESRQSVQAAPNQRRLPLCVIRSRSFYRKKLDGSSSRSFPRQDCGVGSSA